MLLQVDFVVASMANPWWSPEEIPGIFQRFWGRSAVMSVSSLPRNISREVVSVRCALYTAIIGKLRIN